MVLAITIVGAMWISNIMSTSSLTTVSQTPKSIIAAHSVLLVAYDTRDGASLFNIANFDNEFDDPGILCTVSCTTTPNNRPATGGTDFIALQLWNQNSNPIHIKSLQVNGIPHVWDTNTRNVVFDVSGELPKFPRAGMFSIIPTSSLSLTQQKSQQVDGDQEIILVIKLKNTSFTADIALGKPLQILVNIGEVRPAEFIILTGETK